MCLRSVYKEVCARLEKIDFEKLWKGFRPYPFALYNSEIICLEEREFPYDERFRGNTSIEFEGRRIAIWNFEWDPVEDPDLLTAQLVHEMFHCFQLEGGEMNYPDDFELMPDLGEEENFQLKYAENRLLSEAVREFSIERKRLLMAQFRAARIMREKRIGERILQEYRVEHLEGTAEFVGGRALHELSREKYARQIERYVEKIQDPKELTDLRRISYYAGVLYLTCMEALGLLPTYDFSDPRTFYEESSAGLPMVEFSPDTTSDRESVAAALREEKERREAEIRAFFEKKPVPVECDAMICGYDPMNMYRLGDQLFCRHFLMLQTEDSVIQLEGPLVAELREGAAREILRYHHPAEAAKE